MNVIEAVERLHVLKDAERALEYSIEEANRRADLDGRFALRTVLSEITVTREALESKLSEVTL